MALKTENLSPYFLKSKEIEGVKNSVVTGGGGRPPPADSQTPRSVWQIASAKLQSGVRDHHKYQRMRTQLFDQIVFSGSSCLPEQVQRSG